MRMGRRPGGGIGCWVVDTHDPECMGERQAHCLVGNRGYLAHTTQLASHNHTQFACHDGGGGSQRGLALLARRHI
jgi:hypothetical protein